MAVNESGWQEAIARECGIRRGLILHGNVIDIVPSPGTRDRWVSVPEAVGIVLRNKGYRRVVYWDRVSGVSGIELREWQDLQSEILASSRRVPEEGEEYDLGSPVQPRQPTTRNAPTNPAAPLDFLAVVSHVMKQQGADRTAFVLDWSNYLFGNANSLSEAERGWLLLMGKAVRDASVTLALAEVDRPQTLMVLLCPGLSVLPPPLYLGNPLFKEINVPIPSRAQREDAVLALEHVFAVEPRIAPQSRALADFVDSLDGMSMRDIHNLARLSRQLTPGFTAESLVSLYRFGERHSPWEQLNQEKLHGAVEALERRVKGQDHAIDAVNRVMIRAFTGLSGLQHSSKQRTPKGVLFFVGPTGVGKTELAKALAQFLFGDDEACLRFDMSEFNHEHADQRLVGAPPGYVGYEEGGQLTNAVKRRPFSLLLFDEIEKAHPRILDKFLQILEDGRLTDGKGDTVSFADTFIVFTSNIGAAEIGRGDDSGAVRKAFVERVRDHFVSALRRPELLGRIGEANIVAFNFMTDDSFLIEIARSKLEPLRNRLKEKWGVSLRFDDEVKALAAVVADVDRASGGRGVLNALTNVLLDPLAKFLFEKVGSPERSQGRAICVTQLGAQAKFDFDLE